jgi:hypothetical protein
MSLAPVLRGHALLAVALCALSPRLVAAQAGNAVPRADATSGPLRVWVDAPAGAFDKVKLRESLARELRRDVELTDDEAAASVKVRVEKASRADVRYGELSRSVELPPDRERSVQVVSWLTVNLVRDEASELLDQLRARRKEEAEAEARLAAEKAAADKAAAEKAAADKAAAEKAAADKAAADKAAAEKAAADKAAADKAAAAAAAKPQPLLRDPLRSFDVAFITPISLLRDSPKRELKLQLAFLFSDSGGIAGAALSPGVVRVRRDVHGIAAGTAAAIVNGNVDGAVLSAGYAHAGGVLEGVVVGTGAAVHRGAFGRGVVLGAGGAVTTDLTGVVAAGGFATARRLQGVAAAGGLTLVRGRSHGFLLAGGGNFAYDHRGIELAGGFNGGRDLDGLALAPVNVHRNVRGLQIGVVNVAEEVDGAAIGVVSIAKNGRFQPVLWGDRDGSAHVALKSIAGWAFTQLGGGVDLGAESFTYDGGAGVHIKLSQNFYLEPGAHYSAKHSIQDASGAPDEHRLHYLVQAGVRLGNKLDVWVGGGVRHRVVGGSGTPFAPDLRAGISFF